MSYAFISLTPVWCEINVFLFFLFAFFYCFFVLLSILVVIFLFSYLLSFLFVFLYSFIYLFSNTIRPRRINEKFIGIILIAKRFIRE